MRPRRIATRRAVLNQAWFAAKKRIERDGIAQLSAPEEAGRLLELHEGNAAAAHTLCKAIEAAELLAEVVIEEGGAVMPSWRNSR